MNIGISGYFRTIEILKTINIHVGFKRIKGINKIQTPESDHEVIQIRRICH